MYTEVRWDHHSPVRHNEVQWSTVKYSEQKRFSEIQVQSCVVCVLQYVHCSLSLSIWIDPDQAMPSIGNQYHWADQTNIDSTLLRQNKTVCFCAIRRLNQYLGVRRLICVQSKYFSDPPFSKGGTLSDTFPNLIWRRCCFKCWIANLSAI